MYTEKLLVKEGGKRQAVESFHTSVVHPLRILDLTCAVGGINQWVNIWTQLSVTLRSALLTS